jgi:ATP-dependent Clp protease adaptor protein ClpS
MSEAAVAAVEALPEVEAIPDLKASPKERPSNDKPKRQPPYAVIVFNDDEHSFQYVVETFSKVFGYPREKSYLLALAIHNAGRGIVWSGTRELAELKRDQIRSCGPDFYATAKVSFPLGVTIQPLQG